ncbi:16S rRNA (guanine(527)-N(7))-methyltransferase RsmG [Aerococcus kribbianus]|uniref:Ribosomal RNA small subunit methyltransferase G n=1 Tax=Aerococcus kribbianus TaxID=2999064 RepID=A0A9X3FWN9_9LACT|nr:MULTISPECIES: 16S rRNA (guanine(527)-N(7))-methyltransferase RsmG [unclassified Aerococcus]MCZ0717614.1 16S rRNA (guanine(527)-N(7))-methyltransferase RsmG [Aerococcus sp. YH-aer221]MCZ0725902.1 16S rRNA (guanine(527)-N(7))-methyltransferase RsmG [Aerococcus sp. YH-aer222]
MNPDQFQAALADQGINLSDHQMAQFARYYDLLLEWNEKINLTAITEQEDVYLKHFYDSLTLAFYEDFTNDKKLVDVGAGAGFPSIPLKIAFPNLDVTIVDSLNKRVNFLNTVISDLDLSGVSAYHDRAETFGQNPDFRGQFDVATARAVARLNLLAEFCIPLLKKGGQFLAMKAAQTHDEREEANQAIATLGGKFIEDIAFDLPNETGERHIVRIEKRKETPNKYPRRPGKPAKNPL